MTLHQSAFDPDRIAAVPGASATAQVTDALALYGYNPEPGEPDPRPFPETETLDGLVSTGFAAFVEPLCDTALEADLTDLLWSFTNVFHLKADRVQRDLDDNERRQRDAQAEQDGSEVRSVELERLIEQGRSLLERRAAYEHLRDRAAEHYEAHTGMAWHPRSGSKVNHRHLTSAFIDSRDYLAAKRRAETDAVLPLGPKIAFSGGLDYNDQKAIWDVLDKVLAKHPGMVLLHTAGPRGADHIAVLWAKARTVAAVAFKPNWDRNGRAAPFKRNDQLLELLPKGVVVFPGNGINKGFARKARELGLPVLEPVVEKPVA
jgi:hypothetical protein